MISYELQQLRKALQHPTQSHRLSLIGFDTLTCWFCVPFFSPLHSVISLINKHVLRQVPQPGTPSPGGFPLLM